MSDTGGFGKKFLFFRKKLGFTQERISELLGVTRQAVQKWECGTALPDAQKIVAISRLFDVSLDALLLEAQPDDNAARINMPPIPNYEYINGCEAYYSRMTAEVRQSAEEGKDVYKYRAIASEIERLPNSESKKKMADALYQLLESAPQLENYKYIEPSDYPKIAMFSMPERFECNLSDSVLKSKIAGGWLGRICGCLLGKPVEGMRLEELIPFLKETNNYPMHRYLLSSDTTEEIRKNYNYSFYCKTYGDNCSSAPVDDDTNYTIMAQHIISRFGRGFTPENVACIWLESQPRDKYYTAERVAYTNLINGYMPPDSAKYRNSYREWIGAQIRSDYYGYINPGNPQAAAEMAFRDASVSHIKNGIYGSMFVAGMIAAAFCLDDIPKVIRAGLSCIPSTSRLYEYIAAVLSEYERGVSESEAIERIQKDYDDRDVHCWCHTISNAAIVTASLLYGNKDYGKTVCLAVQSGFDTDCNGATAGSVLGVMLGDLAIDNKWYSPINGRLETSVFGSRVLYIQTLIDKTIEQIGK